MEKSGNKRLTHSEKFIYEENVRRNYEINVNVYPFKRGNGSAGGLNYSQATPLACHLPACGLNLLS